MAGLEYLAKVEEKGSCLVCAVGDEQCEWLITLNCFINKIEIELAVCKSIHITLIFT